MTMKVGQTQLWGTTGSLNQGISAVLLENSSPGVCTALWQSGLNKCPQSKLVWNLSCTGPWSFNKFRVSTAEYELGRELQRETKRVVSHSTNAYFSFCFYRRNKSCLLKIKDFCTTMHLPIKLQVKMWKFQVDLQSSCNSLLFLAPPGGVSVLGTAQREQTRSSHSGTKGAQGTKLHQCSTSGQAAAGTR